MLADVCTERLHKDSKHEWMPYRWVKEVDAGGAYQKVPNTTVMKLGELICKYCRERKAV